MHRAWLLLLLLATTVQAQPMEGPGVVVLVHHPDDGIDPLGFSFQESDPFVARHGHFDRFRAGIDYPGIVIDGRVPYDGLPPAEGDAVAATLAVYNGAVTMRHGVETPLTFTLLTNGTRAELTIDSVAAFDGVHLWSALVEDPVHYEPPTGLTNGVFDHPFTTRSITDHGPVAIDGTSQHNWTFTVDPSWDLDHLLLAVWVQQDASDGRFKPHEVVQATMHPVARAVPTVQATRGVLVEAYSATWCDPCLIGDRAIEELAASHGLQPARAAVEPTGYFRAPAPWLWVAMAGAFAAFALVRLPGGKP